MQDNKGSGGIYEDLHNVDLGEKISKLQQENKNLHANIESLQNDIGRLCKELTQMKDTEENLKKNISELFNTAKGEIDRKDKMITELNEQLDNIAFRRQNRFKFNGQTNEECLKLKRTKSPEEVVPNKRYKYDESVYNEKKDRRENLKYNNRIHECSPESVKRTKSPLETLPNKLYKHDILPKHNEKENRHYNRHDREHNLYQNRYYNHHYDDQKRNSRSRSLYRNKEHHKYHKSARRRSRSKDAPKKKSKERSDSASKSTTLKSNVKDNIAERKSTVNINNLNPELQLSDISNDLIDIENDDRDVSIKIDIKGEPESSNDIKQVFDANINLIENVPILKAEIKEEPQIACTDIKSEIDNSSECNNEVKIEVKEEFNRTKPVLRRRRCIIKILS